MKTLHVKGKVSVPIRMADGTWTTVIRNYEDDIPDRGRKEIICNECGCSEYPKCKEDWCSAWVHHRSK